MVCLCVERFEGDNYKHTGVAGVDVMRWGATGGAARGKKQKEAHEGPPVSGKGAELSSSSWVDNERF